MVYKTLLAILIPTLLISSMASAAPVKSLGDLNKVKSMRSVPLSVQSGSKIFFTRTTDAEGAELWVTDGTPAGTILVKDIVPGVDGSQPLNFAPTKIGATPGVYFTADTAAAGRELWISDGTNAGTKIIKDIYPGNSSSFDSSIVNVTSFLSIPDSTYAFFAANNGVNGVELWVTDGTTPGTKLVQDINPGIASSEPSEIKYFPTLPLFVFFSATNNTTGRESYRANDSAAEILHDLEPGIGSSDPADFQLTPTAVIFAARESVYDRELWSSNLVVPTLLADAQPGAGTSYTSNLMPLATDQVLYSSFGVEADLPVVKLMTTNGTPAGTSVLANMDCIPGGVLSLIISSTFKTSKIINGKAIFTCYDLLKASSTFWVSDGTALNTKILKDFLSPPAEMFGSDFPMLQGNNNIIVMANDGQGGVEPWVTDGTTAGTTLLANLNPGEASSSDPYISFLSIIGNNYNSTASIFPATVGTERKVYYSDGSVANTREIFDDSSTRTVDSYPGGFFDLGQKVLFSATDTKKGLELFETNGKLSGTKLLKNIFRAGNSDPGNFVKLDQETALFAASTPKAGRELWRTDGTKAGTKLLKNIRLGVEGSRPFIFKEKLRKKMFFKADDGVHGTELWVTQGTKRTTKLLKDINLGTDSTYLEDLVILGNKAVFVAEDATNGVELWVSNGKNAGTNLLKDINPAGSSSPSGLVVFGERVFFSAYTVDGGRELWATDGTSAGTVLVKDVAPGVSSSELREIVVVGSTLFFTANNGTNGYELWSSDGTTAGTLMVQDIHVGASGSNVTSISPISNTQVVFSADDGVNGTELWLASAGLGSAILLKDINPGAGSASITNLYSVPGKNRAVFSAYTATEGEELWTTDGTNAGTVLLADIAVGSFGSYPNDFFAKGRKLYFSAYTEATGTEPYTIKLPR